MKTIDAANSKVLEFLGVLGRRISQVSDDVRESAIIVPAPASCHYSPVRFYSVAIQGIIAQPPTEDEFLRLGHLRFNISF